MLTCIVNWNILCYFLVVTKCEVWWNCHYSHYKKVKTETKLLEVVRAGTSMDLGSLVWSWFCWLTQVGKLSEDNTESEVTKTSNRKPWRTTWLKLGSSQVDRAHSRLGMRERHCQPPGSQVCCSWTQVFIQRQSKRFAPNFWLELVSKAILPYKKISIVSPRTFYSWHCSCLWWTPLRVKVKTFREWEMWNFKLSSASTPWPEIYSTGVRISLSYDIINYLLEAQQKEESMFGKGRGRQANGGRKEGYGEEFRQLADLSIRRYSGKLSET